VRIAPVWTVGTEESRRMRSGGGAGLEDATAERVKARWPRACCVRACVRVWACVFVRACLCVVCAGCVRVPAHENVCMHMEWRSRKRAGMDEAQGPGVPSARSCPSICRQSWRPPSCSQSTSARRTCKTRH
jgi:hypothetical protein